MANVDTCEEKEKYVLNCQSEGKERESKILRNILEKCKYESIHGLQRPLELYKERVLYYSGQTGLPDEVKEKNITFQLDLFDRTVINDALKKLYLQQRSFSFTDICDIIKDKVVIQEINNFCEILRWLGYKPVNTLNYGQIILENPKFTFERIRYLNKITKLRDSPRTIYYIDERVIDITRTFKKPWIQYEDMSKMEGYVFYHIVSKNGLQKGLFCNQVNEEDFTKWISDIVLSFLQASSVIIMDNNPLHGKIHSEPISMYHSKGEMLSWLQRHNIPCSPNMRKAELYDLIARCPVRDNQYKLDLIFKSHGHEVLRLPQNYHDLSLTELLWEHIRAGPFTSSEQASVINIKQKVYNDIIHLHEDKWNEFESTIKDTEKNIFVTDEAIEQALDLYEIDVKEDN